MLNPKHHVRIAVNLTERAKYKVRQRLSIARDYEFSIDNPRKRLQEKREISVEGWIIPNKPGKFKLRVRNNDRIYEVKTGLKRLDVSKSYPDVPNRLALYSGFSSEFKFEDGLIVVELDSGHGFKKLYNTEVQYGLEDTPASVYNKDLANNYPEHVNLLQNRKKFYYEEASKADYERDQKDARLIAIYLPQFHPFKENDEAWGKGFTEWTNVTAGESRFIGHQQPILPKDLGFYDLRLESNILEQINLAKKYGVYGFCFYYYWFSSCKIMDTPLNTFMEHKEWDFNFTICWANENWTKRWDGRNNDIIIAQEYLDEDPLNFIKDVEAILLDKRYIREDGKPVLMVYRASELKDPQKYATVWRDHFRKKHNMELQLVSYLSFDDQDPREYGFDAALDFAPLSAFFKNKLFQDNQFPFIDVSQKLLDVNFSGIVADYRSIALNDKLSRAFDFPVYPCVTPSWDNDARKKGKGFIYQNSSPDLYGQWLRRIIKQETSIKDEPLVFVNAWNEWAEGAMMEPSSHLGHAVLNRTAEALSAESGNKKNAINFPEYCLTKTNNTKLAVVVHLYYVDLWPQIEAKLNNISVPFDLFITLNERDKDFRPATNKPAKTVTYLVPNRGRDVLPFLYVAARIRAAGYEHVLKIHSKKSKHRKDGSNWFDSVIESLLPSVKVVDQIIQTLNDHKTGIIGPNHHLVSLKRHMGSNKPILKHLLVRAYDKDISQKVVSSPEQYPYFGGTMFWARVDSLDPILDLYLMPDDFQSEHGQIDGTTAHAVERMFGVACRINGRILYQVDEKGLAPLIESEFDQKYTYAP